MSAGLRTREYERRVAEATGDGRYASPILYSHQRPMLRTALAVTLVTAASLGVQSQPPPPQRLSQADRSAILAAARAEVANLAKLPPGRPPRPTNSRRPSWRSVTAPSRAHRM
jgi:hypothetical protein